MGGLRAWTKPPRSAAPFRGSPQCAHWGKGSPGWDTVQEEKDRMQCGPEKTGRSADFSFSHWQSLGTGTLSVLAALGHLSQRERQGRRRSRRADFGIVRSKNRRNRLPKHRHSEEGEARRGNPFSLRRTKIIHRRKGMRIPTTSLRTGLGMTGRFKTYAPIFWQCKNPRPAGRCPF